MFFFSGWRLSGGWAAAACRFSWRLSPTRRPLTAPLRRQTNDPSVPHIIQLLYVTTSFYIFDFSFRCCTSSFDLYSITCCVYVCVSVCVYACVYVCVCGCLCWVTVFKISLNEVAMYSNYIISNPLSITPLETPPC